jgi:hypothetical protein
MARLIDEHKIVTPTLLKRFLEEAVHDGDNEQHCAYILRASGDLLTHHPFSLPAAPEQMMFAADALRFLNRELHHDGAWVLVFTDPKPVQLETVLHMATHADYARYVFLWMDADGDVQFPMEWVEGQGGDLDDFSDVLIAGLQTLGKAAEHAYKMWTEAMRALDARPQEQFKRAAGERAPSAGSGRAH